MTACPRCKKCSVGLCASCLLMQIVYGASGKDIDTMPEAENWPLSRRRLKAANKEILG